MPPTPAQPRTISPTLLNILPWVTILALLLSLLATVLTAQLDLSNTGGPGNTLYEQATREITALTFIRVVILASAFWLVILQQRAGYFIALIIGILSLILLGFSETVAIKAFWPQPPLSLLLLTIISAIILIGSSAVFIFNPQASSLSSQLPLRRDHSTSRPSQSLRPPEGK
ncbi:MAG: hypothetical protein M1396_05445 [Chloroflexi bacterium]|nr:hypothetical protein [Chloroflexota bacterium]